MGERKDRARESWERLCRAARHWGGDGVCELSGGPPVLLSALGSTMIEATGEPDGSIALRAFPVKPLGEDEAAIRNAYRTKLTGLYQKLKG